MEATTIQQRDRCLPALLEKPQGGCFHPILLHREGSRENPARQRYNNFNNPSMTGAAMASKGTPSKHLEPNSNTQDRKSSFGSNISKTSLSEKQSALVGGMGKFSEKLPTEGLSEEAARRNSTVSHYESSWKKRSRVRTIFLMEKA